MRISAAPIVTSVTGLQWPALPHAAAQTMMTAQFQFERSQYWPAAQLAAHQLMQLRSLLAFVLQQVPYYRALAAQHQPELLRNPQALTWEDFARWPLLRKADVREKSAALVAASLPADHGGSSWQFTSGSTGEPTRCAASMVTQFFRSAATMRGMYWYDLDLALTYGAVRPGVSAGRSPGWGAVPNVAYETGPQTTLPVGTGVAEQLDWLLAEKPGYLHTMPSIVRALVLHSRETGRVPTSLDAVLTYAESLPDDLRALVRDTWGTRLIDLYSSTEFGTIALQCPHHEHYHVQAETLIVEILREDDTPCAPGETGRVVVTDLTNFAMPLIRYEHGDYAQAGAPCDCGRTLPVISRVYGRYRQMAVDPTGRVFWPSYPDSAWAHLAPLQQMQFVQHTPQTTELRYVMERDLTADEQAGLSAAFGASMGYPFEFRYTRQRTIARLPGGKFEQFICLCPPRAA